MASDIFFLNSKNDSIHDISSVIIQKGGTIEYTSPVLPIIAFKSDLCTREYLNDHFELDYVCEAPNGHIHYENLTGSVSQFTPLQIVPKVDFSLLRNANLTGWGKTIAILDSGISEEWVKEHHDFTGFGSDPAFDHGNKVANIIKRFSRGSRIISCKVTQSPNDVKLMMS